MLQVSLLTHLIVITLWILFIDSFDTLCHICSHEIKETAGQVQDKEEILLP